jgi:hypothetical protein
VFALIVTANPVAADSRDYDPYETVPACLGAMEFRVPSSMTGDGTFAHTCVVRMYNAPGTPWHAFTNEWVLFNMRVAFANQADCLSANITAKATFNGDPVALETLPCQVPPPPPIPNPPPPQWIITFRFLSHPLAPGTHTMVFKMTRSGVTTPLTQTVTVTQG